MKFRVLRAAWTGIAAIACAAPAAAQQSPVEVTFELPLNLTRLPTGIPKVKVSCDLSSQAIMDSIANPVTRSHTRTVELEIPVSQGQVIQIAQLVISLDPQELDDPSGKQANYNCMLRAFDPNLQAWLLFSGSSGSARTTTVILTPAPAPITGAFVW